MSYTIFCREVTKWLKDNELPWKGTAWDSKEITQARLDAWQLGTVHILEKWISEKRYKELISCAHSGYFKDYLFFEPLAKHFVDKKLFGELRYLCERGIRFEIKNMLSVMKYELEEQNYIDIKNIQSFNLETYAESKGYNQLGEIAKYRKRALALIGRYVQYLRSIDAPLDYMEMIARLQERVFNVSVKKSDIKQLNYKLLDIQTNIKNK